MVPPAAVDRTGPPFDVLLPLDLRDLPDLPDPATRRLDPLPGEPALSVLYDHPDPGEGRVWVRANMIASLDGGATGSDGRSGSLNGPADHRVFDLLRGLADVVLVGAGTVRAEGYRELPVRRDLAAGRAERGQHPDLRLAVVSRSGSIPADVLDGDLLPLVLTVADRPDLAALRERIGAERLVVAGTGDVDLATALAELGRRGLPRVLAEGGARVLGDLLVAGLVDDLCLTTVPELVAGPARRVVDRTDWFAPPLAARPAHLLHSDGVLLGRWLLGREGTVDPAVA
jgi:riboflavin biosynthesis pyrimidine reductase